MARIIHDTKLETRAARARLRPRKKPYYKTLVPGRMALGYHRKRQHTPGRWLVRVYLGNEVYRITSLGIADDFADAASGHVLSYAEAQSCALALKTDTRRHDGATVEDAIAAHVAWMHVDRPSAAAEFNRTAECHILPRLGAIPLAALTTEQIVAWRDALVAAPAYHARRPYPISEDGRRARRASVNRVWTCLRAALNRAFDQGMVTSNTAWKRVRPLRNTNAARQRFLSVEEVRRLINAADAASGFRALMHAALLSGCRYGELCKLDVQDFRHNKLHVLRSKSGRERWIVLTEEGVAFFAALTAGRAGHEPLLRRNGERWRKDQQQAPTAAACRAARITPRIVFHGLRHTYASLCVMNGMPLMVLAQNLGHADVTMVTRHYGHLESTYVDAEVRRSAPRFGLVDKGNIRALRPKARVNE